MTKFKLCGTAIAALMISTLPALAVVGEDGQQVDCGGEICITSGGTDTGKMNRGATLTRQGKGGVTVENSGSADNPTGRSQNRRSSNARPAMINVGEGDQCDPSVCDGQDNN